MSHKQLLKKLLLQNNEQEIKTYYIFNNIKVENINDTTFDLLIFALDHNASDNIILFLINQYTHCDYETLDKQIPIYVALAHNRFEIAEALLHRQANINRKNSNGDNLLIYLCKEGKLNRRNLSFALHHHIDINAKDNVGKKILYYLIHGEAVSLVKMLLKYYIFDTPFILQLLQYHRYQKGLSDQELCHILHQETQKLDISQSLYFSAIKNGNLDIIQQLYINDGHAHFYAPIPSLQLTPSLTPVPSLDTSFNSPDFRNLLFHSSNNEDANTNNTALSITNNSTPSSSSHNPLKTNTLLSAKTSDNINSSFSKPSNNIIDRYNMLIHATIKNELTLVNYFLELGANVNKSNNKGDTALIIAAFKGQLDIVQTLLKHGANVNHCNKRHYTALIYASEKNHHKVVKELINYGAFVNQQENEGNTPLILASLFGCKDTIRILLQEERCDSYLKNHHGWSAVHCATLYHHLNTLKILLDHGLPIDDCNEKGITPLHIAAENGDKNIVQYLVTRGARLDYPSQTGKTALMFAAARGHLDTVKCLIDGGAQLEAIEMKGDTPLMHAVYNGHVEVVRYLTEKGANLHIRNSKMATPAIYATSNQHPEVLKYLLEHNADVESQDSLGWSPLLIATKSGHLEMMQLLIEYHVPLDQQETGGRTALMIAVENYHLDSMKLLVKAGSPLTQQDKHGHTACVIAAFHDYQDIVKYLLEEGYRQEEDLLLRKQEILNSYVIAMFKENTSVIRYLSYYITKHKIRY
ncbi:ankyrin [Piromyces finnis]|uniref:Ankyrin n=1 Tax=Piromyces finnis TaxID=1754191 RepID=A0A1Y1V0Z1_9FUNG|nr:ankyrin [Piromyces finnis]|eukprot:ORX44833.1 ankyrin [Piromyces finnis]